MVVGPVHECNLLSQSSSNSLRASRSAGENRLYRRFIAAPRPRDRGIAPPSMARLARFDCLALGPNCDRSGLWRVGACAPQDAPRDRGGSRGPAIDDRRPWPPQGRGGALWRVRRCGRGQGRREKLNWIKVAWGTVLPSFPARGRGPLLPAFPAKRNGRRRCGPPGDGARRRW